MSNKFIGSIHVGCGEYDKEAGRLYEANYDRIFGKSRAENAKRSAEERARESADAARRHSAKVEARTARARARGDRHLAEMAARDEAMNKGRGS